MTARAQTADIDAYMLMGAIGVIPKPFSPIQLSDQIRRIWELQA